MRVSDQPPAPDGAISLADFQELIRTMYLEKDVARGIDGTFMWLIEEVGELAAALRDGSHEEKLGEFADVLVDVEDWSENYPEKDFDSFTSIETPHGLVCLIITVPVFFFKDL